MNLVQLFDLSLVDRKDSLALIFGDETFTFGQLEERSNQMVHLLLNKGCKAGDRICIYLENCVEMIDLYIACAKTGIVFVPINILYKEREVSHILADAEPRLLVANGEVPGGFDAFQLADLVEEVKTQPQNRLSIHTTGDSPAALVYTSGTTGTSKGAILTHNNFISNGVNITSCWKITEADRFLLSLPLFHVHGLANGVHCWLISGCLMKLLVRFEHQKATEELLGYRPSLFFGVPTVFIRMLDFDDATAKQIGENGRLFVSGSAPLPAQVMEAFEQKYGSVILERYGMTETLMNISNPYVGERRAGTVGFPLPGISAKVVDNNGEIAAVGEEGEVYIKGPNVFAGYWKRPDATKEAFVDGYFKTGDIGILSEDGYFTLKGRKSDLIISGGFNIYPREIEEFLTEQQGVIEAAVVGMPHETRGEVPIAYLVVDKTYNAELVEAACKYTFASFKIPRSFNCIEKIPRTALGKVQKHLLKDVK